MANYRKKNPNSISSNSISSSNTFSNDFGPSTRTSSAVILPEKGYSLPSFRITPSHAPSLPSRENMPSYPHDDYLFGDLYIKTIEERGKIRYTLIDCLKLYPKGKEGFLSSKKVDLNLFEDLLFRGKIQYKQGS